MVVYIRHHSGIFYDFYYISKDPLVDSEYVDYPYWDSDGWVTCNPYHYSTYSDALADALKNGFIVEEN